MISLYVMKFCRVVQYTASCFRAAIDYNDATPSNLLQLDLI